MASQTPKQRKAAERFRKRAAGLRPLEAWARPEHHERIKKYLRKLNKDTAA